MNLVEYVEVKLGLNSLAIDEVFTTMTVVAGLVLTVLFLFMQATDEETVNAPPLRILGGLYFLSLIVVFSFISPGASLFALCLSMAQAFLTTIAIDFFCWLIGYDIHKPFTLKKKDNNEQRSSNNRVQR